MERTALIQPAYTYDNTRNILTDEQGLTNKSAIKVLRSYRENSFIGKSDIGKYSVISCGLCSIAMGALWAVSLVVSLPTIFGPCPHRKWVTECESWPSEECTSVFKTVNTEFTEAPLAEYCSEEAALYAGYIPLALFVCCVSITTISTIIFSIIGRFRQLKEANLDGLINHLRSRPMNDATDTIQFINKNAFDILSSDERRELNFKQLTKIFKEDRTMITELLDEEVLPTRLRILWQFLTKLEYLSADEIRSALHLPQIRKELTSFKPFLKQALRIIPSEKFPLLLDGLIPIFQEYLRSQEDYWPYRKKDIECKIDSVHRGYKMRAPYRFVSSKGEKVRFAVISDEGTENICTISLKSLKQQSPYFESAFRGEWNESKKKIITITDLNPDELSQFTNLLLGIRVTINEENVDTLASLANRFQVTHITLNCGAFYFRNREEISFEHLTEQAKTIIPIGKLHRWVDKTLSEVRGRDLNILREPEKFRILWHEATEHRFQLYRNMLKNQFKQAFTNLSRLHPKDDLKFLNDVHTLKTFVESLENICMKKKISSVLSKRLKKENSLKFCWEHVKDSKEMKWMLPIIKKFAQREDMNKLVFFKQDWNFPPEELFGYTTRD